MEEEIARKLEELKLQNKRISLIEEELDLLKRADTLKKEIHSLQSIQSTQSAATSPAATAPSHYEAFPIGSPVRFSLSTSEKAHLRGKKA